MAANDVIATSLNPGARLEEQIASVRQWKKLGYKTLCFQSEQESKRLSHAGIESEDIVHIQAEDTAQNLVGKPIPRIAPVLRIVQRDHNPDSLILVNSDIYPIARSKMAQLGTMLQCAALTRQDCLSLELPALERSIPYRGGLDIFFFTKAALSVLLKKLSEIPVAENMTFGIPGWDYFLGGLIMDTELGGEIIDSGLCYHIAHRTTYRHLHSAKPYIDYLRNIGLVSQTETADAAAEFAAFIESCCQRNVGKSTLLNRLYRDYRLPAVGAPLPIDEFLHRTGILHLSQCRETLDTVWKYLQRPDFSGPAAMAYYAQHKASEVKFFQMLECLLLILHALKQKGELEFRTSYPDSTFLKKEVEFIQKRTDASEARLHALCVVTGDLVEHKCLSPHLLQYLVLSCINDNERRVLGAIITTLTEKSYVEAA